jgi:hypothetical protein
MGLIANVSDDRIQMIGYTDTVSYIKDTTTYEYYIISTMSMFESVEGQALGALETSIQNETYDEVLSQCLGRVVSGVSGSFTTTRSDLPTSDTISMSTLLESTDGPTTTPTPPPTRLDENCKHCRYFEMSKDKYCCFVLYMVLDVSLCIY